MHTHQKVTHPQKARRAPSVALGFFIVGIVSLCVTLAILLLHPQIAFGDPYRLGFLSFAALIGFGLIGSFAFGSAYVIAPIMGGGSIFNDRLTFYHLLLHGGGLACLILVLGTMNFLETTKVGLVIGLVSGLSITLLGAGLHIINLVLTASRHNRWEPEQMSLMTSLFWLGLTVILGTAVLVHHFYPFLSHDPQLLLKSHAPLALVGFIWLGLMGCSLKLFNMFLITKKTPATLSWTGWVLINVALFLFVPLALLGPAPDFLPKLTAGLILAGTLCYLLDIVRIWLGARSPYHWGLSGAFIGLVSGPLFILWILMGTPLADSPELTFGEIGRVLFILAAFGSCTVVILGLSMHLVPFLVWQIRCAPLVGHHKVPSPKTLESRGSPAAAVIFLVAAWLYLAYGQWTDSTGGTQMAALFMVVALFWFARSLLPAFKTFVYGVSLHE